MAKDIVCIRVANKEPNHFIIGALLSTKNLTITLPLVVYRKKLHMITGSDVRMCINSGSHYDRDIQEKREGLLLDGKAEVNHSEACHAGNSLRMGKLISKLYFGLTKINTFFLNCIS